MRRNTKTMYEWRKMTAKIIVSDSEDDISDDIEVQAVEDTTERTKRPPTRPIVRPSKKKRGWLN